MHGPLGRGVHFPSFSCGLDMMTQLQITVYGEKNTNLTVDTWKYYYYHQ